MNFKRIADHIDAGALRAAVLVDESLWTLDTYWKDHPNPTFADVDSIYLRFPEKAPYVFPTEAAKAKWLAEVDPYECFDEAVFDMIPARPLVDQVMQLVGGARLGRVMINRLPPGKYIRKHSDGTGEKYYQRYHIPLLTNDGVDFRCGNERAQMPVGSAWWFDNFQEHEIWNRGDCDRVHLVMDIK